MFDISRFILNAQTKKTAAEETGAVYYRGARVDKQSDQAPPAQTNEPPSVPEPRAEEKPAPQPKANPQGPAAQQILVRDLPETRGDKRYAPLVGLTFTVVRTLDMPTAGRRYCVEVQPGQLLWLLENMVEPVQP